MGSTEKKSVPFNGTAEQEKALREVIAAHKDQQGALMPILQQAQDIYGYLPIEVQTIIAEETGIPLEKISVCLGTACYVKGAQALVDRITQVLGIAPDECTADGKFSLEACRCIGACGLAPVLTINDDVYGKLTVKDLDDVLAKYAD